MLETYHMKFKDLLYITIQNFRNRMSRAFFTILGVAVAISVVLSLVSFGYGFQKNILERITTEASLLSLDIVPSDIDVIKFDDNLIDSIEHIPSVERVSPEANMNGQITFEGVVTEAAMNLVGIDFLELDGKVPVAGSLFSDASTKEIIVTTPVAELFGLTPEEILEKKMLFTISLITQGGDTPSPRILPGGTDAPADATSELSFGDDFKIVGVVDTGRNIAEAFIITRDFAQVSIEQYDFAKVKVSDALALETVRTELIHKGFIVSALSDTVAQTNRVFRAIQVTLGIFGIFALVVAGIGLVNTMTISLLERTNEIGIMRAIGADPIDIRRLFLFESVAIGFMGGLFGILLGITMSELLNVGFNILARSFGGEATRLFTYPVWFILFILLLSTAVGFLGGVWPARRAEHMNPLRALRYK